MDFEKLKPWNWFKHEDDAASQIPVKKDILTDKKSTDKTMLSAPENRAVGHFMQLHQEMDRLFDNVWRSLAMPTRSILMEFNNSLLNPPTLGGYQAKLDVSGSQNEYEISIDLPGLSQDDIQIELDGNTLIVKGKTEHKSESQDKQYYRIERNVGAFQRTLSLPEDADEKGILATMKNGLLNIQIPRKTLPKDNVQRIPISS